MSVGKGRVWGQVRVDRGEGVVGLELSVSLLLDGWIGLIDGMGWNGVDWMD